MSENKGRKLTNEELSQQLVAEDQLYYSRLHNSEDCIEQYLDEAGNLYYQDDDGNWILNTTDS